MKKILFAVVSLLCLMPVCAQPLTAGDSVKLAPDSLSAVLQADFPMLKKQTNEVTKSEGDSAYLRNDYADAIEIYETLLKKGEAAELYYNLGNAYYKKDDIAKAILNYERALLLQPGNVDIRANLEIARAKTVDKVNSIPEIFFISWLHSLINTQNTNSWAKWAVVWYLLFLVSLACFFFSRKVMWKKIGFSSAVFFCLVCVSCNLFAKQQKNKLTERNYAIVMDPSITVRSTPSESGTSLFVLHEGRKIEIKDNTMQEWKEIRLEDGKVGWVPSKAIEII